jgi:hypothetical protein
VRALPSFARKALQPFWLLGGGALATAAVVVSAWSLRRAGSGHVDEAPVPAAGWLSPDEREIAAALASLIVPPDDTGPGAAEAAVVDGLDQLLAASPERQPLYRSGLQGFATLAWHRHGRPFSELTTAERLDLVTLVDGITARTAWTRTGSRGQRVRRRIAAAYHRWPAPGAWHGAGDAAAFFPRLTADVLAAFYTSPVAWAWLGYDGPPMPDGYLTTERRAWHAPRVEERTGA